MVGCRSTENRINNISAANKRMKPTMLTGLVLRLFSFLSVFCQVSFHCVSRIAAYARSVRQPNKGR